MDLTSGICEAWTNIIILRIQGYVYPCSKYLEQLLIVTFYTANKYKLGGSDLIVAFHILINSKLVSQYSVYRNTFEGHTKATYVSW